MASYPREVIDAHRALAVAGQADLVWGHVGVRDPDGRGVWTKAAGWGLEEVDGDRLVLVSPEGEQILGSGRRHIECFIHTEVMNARQEINVTVHTHAAAAISFAALDVPMLPLSHDAIPFLGPDVARYTASGDLIKDAGRGAALAGFLGDTPGCVIPGHGLVTVGRDAAEAIMRAVLLERACRVQLEALAAGEVRRWSSEAEVRDKRSGLWPRPQFEAGYSYLVRRAETLYGPVS
jgi:ribulose-5-phosphate 4-epimerase/fuculose-1-phosphate aldolase